MIPGPSHPHPSGDSSAEPPRDDVGLPLLETHLSALSNGLQTVIHPEPGSGVASVQVWCHTGSIHEGHWLGAGLSHLLEHLLFKGTATRSPTQISRAIEDAGGAINAYTATDHTVYYVDIPAAGVDLALAILADMVLHSTLPAGEYERERDVIRREIAMCNDNPDHVAGRLLCTAAYRVHPYRFPIIGLAEIFERTPHEDVAAYYRRRYAPDNLAVVVAGDIDPAHVRSQIEESFGAEPRRSIEPVHVPAEPPQLSPRAIEDFFPTDLSRLHLAWHIPAFVHPDTPAFDLLACILGGGRSSRLYRLLREERGLVHSVGATAFTPTDPGLFTVSILADAARADEAQRAALDLVAGFRCDGPVEAELAKAKRCVLARHISSLATAHGKAAAMGVNRLLTGDPDFSRSYLAALQQVTPDDLRAVAQRHLNAACVVVAALHPRPASTRRPASVPGPALGAVERHVFSNGLTLLTRVNARLPTVAMHAVFMGGVLAEPAGCEGLCRLFSQTLAKGTLDRDAESIAREIEGVGGWLATGSGRNSFQASASVLRPDIELGLDLLADVLLHAVHPDPALERERQVQLAAIREESDHVTVIARRLLRERLFPGHPYASPTLGRATAVARFSRDDVLAFGRRHLCARNCVLAIFGDIDPERTRRLVEERLADLPEGERMLSDPPMPAPLTTHALVEEVADKEQAVLMIGVPGASVRCADRPALDLIAEACSDMSSRLFVRIREQMGLAYFVGAAHAPGLVPGFFDFHVGTDPARLAETRSALEEEIDRLAAHGLEEEELARARRKLLGGIRLSMQTASQQAERCALDELYGLGYDALERFTRQIENTPLDEVRAVARRRFARSQRTTVIVRPGAPGMERTT